MKKIKGRIPSEYRVLFFVLAAFFLVAGGSRLQKWVEDRQIQQRFEQALASFDEQTMEFTLTYSANCGKVEHYQLDSSQLTLEQRRQVGQYVQGLSYSEFQGLLEGGVSLSVHYRLPSGENMVAGPMCWLEDRPDHWLEGAFDSNSDVGSSLLKLLRDSGEQKEGA